MFLTAKYIWLILSCWVRVPPFDSSGCRMFILFWVPQFSTYWSFGIFQVFCLRTAIPENFSNDDDVNWMEHTFFLFPYLLGITCNSISGFFFSFSPLSSTPLYAELQLFWKQDTLHRDSGMLGWGFSWRLKASLKLLGNWSNNVSQAIQHPPSCATRLVGGDANIHT